jgi:ribonuclease P protein component
MKLVAIKENHLFGKAYAKGKRYTTRLVSVYCLKDLASGKIKKQLRLDTPTNRIGISASKKVGGAVQRNRAKRVVRAGLAQLSERYSIRGGNLIVIAVRASAVNAKSTDIEKDLFYAFKKLDLINFNKDPEAL